jgi:hypothetical protein
MHVAALERIAGGDGSKTFALLGDAPRETKKRRDTHIRGHSEQDEHLSVIRWCRSAGDRLDPDIARVYSYPAEAVFKTVKAVRGTTTEQAAAIVAKLKEMGLATGKPDLAFDCGRRGFHGLRIEMKRREFRSGGKVVQTAGKVSKAQEDEIKKLNLDNYYAVVCWGEIQAIEIIKWYFGVDNTVGFENG